MSAGTASLRTWYRGFIQGKTRVVMAWAFAVLLVFNARQYPSFPGVLLCFAGATLRFWASGFLRKDNQIAVGGPYGYTRNPLYLGTYFMAVGVALAIEAWVLLIGTTFLFAVVYHYIILDEETKLKRLFGAPFELYCKTVPRFFPALLPPDREAIRSIQPDESRLIFSWPLAKKNRAFEAYWSFLGLIAFVAIVAYLFNSL